MYPTKKTYTVIKEYWDCGACDTKHRSEYSADHCIKATTPDRIKLTANKYRSRRLEMARMYLNNGTFKTIGDYFGISPDASGIHIKKLFKECLSHDLGFVPENYGVWRTSKKLHNQPGIKSWWIKRFFKLEKYYKENNLI